MAILGYSNIYLLSPGGAYLDSKYIPSAWQNFTASGLYESVSIGDGTYKQFIGQPSVHYAVNLPQFSGWYHARSFVTAYPSWTGWTPLSYITAWGSPEENINYNLPTKMRNVQFKLTFAASSVHPWTHGSTTLRTTGDAIFNLVTDMKIEGERVISAAQLGSAYVLHSNGRSVPQSDTTYTQNFNGEITANSSATIFNLAVTPSGAADKVNISYPRPSFWMSGQFYGPVTD